MKTMRKEIIAIMFSLMMLSSPLITVSAVTWPYLPTTVVQMTTQYGTSSYFITTLNGVAAGFDVENEGYAGWCIDRETTMIRGVTHNVKLYSSLTPPETITENWVAINYILNHKQGTRTEIQNAIWYFTDYISTLTPATQSMITAAKANRNYDPSTGSVLAVICLRQTGSRGVQNSIIELTRDARDTNRPGLSPGYWKHNVKVYNGGPGRYSAPDQDMNRETKATMEAYAMKIIANHRNDIPLKITTPRQFLRWANDAYLCKVNPTDHSLVLTITNWFNEAALRNPYNINQQASFKYI